MNKGRRIGHHPASRPREPEFTEKKFLIGKTETEKTSLDNANRPPQGIAVGKNDLAEIDLLIRKGTPVTIILDKDDPSRFQASNLKLSR